MKATLILATSVAALVTGPLLAQENVVLRYQLRPGQSLRYRGSHQMVYEGTVSGSTQKSEMQANWEREWRIESVDQQGNAQVVMTLYSIKVAFDTPTGKRSFDSQKDPDTPFSNIIGKPMLRATLSRSGKLTNMKHLLKETNNQFLGNAQNLLCPVPDVPVALGTGWQQDVDVALPNQGKVKVRQTYKLQGQKNAVATISFSSAPVTEINDKNQLVQLAQYLPTGTISFDTRSGMLTAQNLKLEKRIEDFAGEGSVMSIAGSYRETIVNQVAGKDPDIKK